MSTEIYHPVENSEENLSFEQAFDLLEQIVSTLENGELPLDRSIELYERGQALGRHCIQLLENAEIRINRLAGDRLEPLSSGSPDTE